MAYSLLDAEGQEQESEGEREQECGQDQASIGVCKCAVVVGESSDARCCPAKI